MNVAERSEALIWMGLMGGFLGTLLVAVIVILVTNMWWWHVRFHLGRGILRFMSCDHCGDQWAGRARRR